MNSKQPSRTDAQLHSVRRQFHVQRKKLMSVLITNVLDVTKNMKIHPLKTGYSAVIVTAGGTKLAQLTSMEHFVVISAAQRRSAKDQCCY